MNALIQELISAQTDVHIVFILSEMLLRANEWSVFQGGHLLNE